MNPAAKKKQILIMFLSLAAIGLLAAIFYSPVWWVSLTAPNYPEEAFPDGVRIQFHMNGVFNGCKKIDKEEITEDEALDCVHEMDTINHYVGMYPIAAGGVVERAFSPFLITFLSVMVLGFACTKPKLRMGILGIGFAVIAVWMYMSFYGSGGLKYQNAGYLHAMVTALDQDSANESASSTLSASEALIARLKASMGEIEKTENKEMAQGGAKANSISHLKNTFTKFQERLPANEKQKWDGSGLQLMSWHYATSLGRYFNNPEEINPMVSKMTIAGHVLFWGIIAAMLLLIVGARRNSGPLFWLLVLVPMALPVFFIIEYSAWLWWYGHRLNAMGAFTVKPFMPTVFGDGKVAQFTTHSYPDLGFGLMLLLMVVLAATALLRRKQLRDLSAES